MRIGVLANLALAVAGVATAIQLPFGGAQPPRFHHLKGHHSQSTYDALIKHFSADRSGTDIVLQKAVETAHSKLHVITTQDRMFDPFRYAAESTDRLLMEELDSDSVKRAVFFHPMNRTDEGRMAEQVVFSQWSAARGEDEFTLIMATWPEGFQQVVQWHVVSEKAEAAKSLVNDVMVFCSRTSVDDIWVFDQGRWMTDREISQAVQKASWDDVILDSKFKARLQHDYRSFFDSKETYKRLNVPWKRGLIFLGPPGNGKTISLKAIMHEVQELDIMILYVKTLHSFYQSDEEALKTIFAKARRESPCILVFEDLDSLINDNNRSYFLNEVDGVSENDGLLMIGTTNHFDRLDPGLSSRPSRFDRKYNFSSPKKEQRRHYAVYWQDKLKDVKDVEFPDSLVDAFADKTDKFSFAFMKEAFVSTLLMIATDESGDKPDFGKLLLEQVANLRKELEDGGDKDVVSSRLGRGGGGRDDGPEDWGFGHPQLPQDGPVFIYHQQQ